MTTTTNRAVIDRAAEIGREHAAEYLSEFGEAPTRDGCGDWDATAWQDAARTLNAEFDAEIRDDEGLYERTLDAYRSGLFGSN